MPRGARDSRQEFYAVKLKVPTAQSQNVSREASFILLFETEVRIGFSLLIILPFL